MLKSSRIWNGIWENLQSMIAIQPIQPHQIEQAKHIVLAVSLEIWDGVFTEEDLKCYSMADIGLKFYQKLGFYRIERYNDSDCTVFMEKII